MALRRVFQSSIRTRTAFGLVRGGGGSIAPPTFARLPAPSAPLHEEHELLWDDGVAPELCLDYDVYTYSKWEGLAWWLGGFGFFGSLALFLGVVWDPKGRKRTVAREMPFDNLREELGGYDAPPS